MYSTSLLGKVKGGSIMLSVDKDTNVLDDKRGGSGHDAIVGE